MSIATRNDVKTLASNIELFAKQVQDKIANNGDYASVASELIRNTVTFTIAVGENHAAEQLGKPTKTTTSSRLFKRDSRGRFAS